MRYLHTLMGRGELKISTWKWPLRIYRKHVYLPQLYRNLSLNEKKDLNDDQNSRDVKNLKNGYTTVYKFSYIRHVSAISRLKTYQVILTAAGIPTSIMLAQDGTIFTEIIPTTIYLGLSMCILLFTISLISQRLIGFIYFNEERNKVKVAYLDIWGNRKEKEMQPNDIVPLSETDVNYLTSHFYLPFQQFSDKEVLKINLRYGQIVDKQHFNKLFLIEAK